MSNQPIFIFDIDGTVALIDHRRHILEDDTLPDKWRVFYSMCDQDLPNMPVLAVLLALSMTGAQILFFTGRSEEVRGKTLSWLAQHTPFSVEHMVRNNMLIMRPVGNYTKDFELKEQWLDGMLIVDRERVRGVFDDRQSVVDMWRRNGLTCFQVAPGDF